MKLLDGVLQQVRATPDIRVATLFGSHARSWLRGQNPADEWSDVDLQIVTTAPRGYASFAWARAVPGQQARVCAQRQVFGGVSKYTILYDSGELDLVVVPYRRLWIGRACFRLGLHRRIKALRRGLSSFADLMRFEHVVVKGGSSWEEFYQAAGRDLPRLGLNDREARLAADLAYVDARWILGRLARGELISAQRMLHRSVVETNIRLLHEWRERRGAASHHRARRAEAVLPPDELKWIAADSRLDADSIAMTTRALIGGMRQLVAELTGRPPDWPEL